ncbi:DUF1206 domain-containing protein [Croceibacterium sp. TMG7-5b_MA50]|uniref:DUF1206 domain-containing protein n=1 Tax=Croceibacterium sp. TMG7-5b_MA50 TaxID=3121290 RepID=UPI003221D44B
MVIDKSEQFERAVRLGFLARAAIYILLGVLALASSSEVSDGPAAAFDAIGEAPGGTALLWLTAAGLVAYALFRLASTLLDIEHEGSDKIGWAKRIGHAGSAIGHLLLAWSAFQFATTGQAADDSARAQEVAAGVLSVNLGPVLLALAGLAFLATAVFQAREGLTGSFMHMISRRAPAATRQIGAAGYLARAVVFAIIGWSLVQAAWGGTSSGIKSIGSAISSLADTGIAFQLVAVGLLLFGIFSLVLARYRIIPELDVDMRIPTFRL